MLGPRRARTFRMCMYCGMGNGGRACKIGDAQIRQGLTATVVVPAWSALTDRSRANILDRQKSGGSQLSAIVPRERNSEGKGRLHAPLDPAVSTTCMRRWFHY